MMQVFHAQHKSNRMDCAVKVMDQQFIRKENKSAFVITERKVMSRLSHPNVVKFYCSFRVRLSQFQCRPEQQNYWIIVGWAGAVPWKDFFDVFLCLCLNVKQDKHSLYLVMELCRGGDLYGLIRLVIYLIVLIYDTINLLLLSSKEYQMQRLQGVLDTACSYQLTQFYMAELVNALEYMHSQVRYVV